MGRTLIMSEQRISTNLWFDRNAEDAANFYVSLFPNSKITHVMRYGEGAPLPKGTALQVAFTLDGTEYLALNGGPHYQLSPAVSLVIKCDDQKEVDRLWAALLKDGGRESQCGWLTDKYGLSWQVIPKPFLKMIGDPDEKRVGRVFAAMMQMVKLDLPTLQKAYDGH